MASRRRYSLPKCYYPIESHNAASIILKEIQSLSEQQQYKSVSFSYCTNFMTCLSDSEISNFFSELPQWVECVDLSPFCHNLPRSTLENCRPLLERSTFKYLCVHGAYAFGVYDTKHVLEALTWRNNLDLYEKVIITSVNNPLYPNSSILREMHPRQAQAHLAFASILEEEDIVLCTEEDMEREQHEDYYDAYYEGGDSFMEEDQEEEKTLADDDDLSPTYHHNHHKWTASSVCYFDPNKSAAAVQMAAYRRRLEAQAGRIADTSATIDAAADDIPYARSKAQKRKLVLDEQTER